MNGHILCDIFSVVAFAVHQSQIHNLGENGFQHRQFLLYELQDDSISTQIFDQLRDLVGSFVESFVWSSKVVLLEHWDSLGGRIEALDISAEFLVVDSHLLFRRFEKLTLRDLRVDHMGASNRSLLHLIEVLVNLRNNPLSGVANLSLDFLDHRFI